MITVREGSPQHWAIRLAGAAAVFGMLVYIPTKMGTANVGKFADAFIIVIAAMGLNLVLGYAGQISIGHSAFFGFGAYTTAILVVDHGWSPGWTFFPSFAITFVVGALVALPALRVKGVYLALVTLAVAVLFPTLLRYEKLEWLTNGSSGFKGVRYEELPSWPFLGDLKKNSEGRATFSYWLAVIVMVVCYLICRGIVKSRVGRSLVAIRDNETAAAVMGVNLAATKTLVFGFSAAICAMAGSVAALRITVVEPTMFNLTLYGSIIFLVAMVIGGAGSLWGPIVGGLVYFFVDSKTKDWAEEGGSLDFAFGWSDISPSTIIFATLLIVLIFVAPRGLVGLAGELSRKVVVVVPAPVGPRAAVVEPIAAPVTPQGDNA